MIKVYGCTDCGQIRIGSMRGTFECPKCRKQMLRLGLTFLEFTEMSEQERISYGLRLAAEHGQRI